tara:strand:+ start:11723 stop:12436 length:714 start_codon:yes stop_codon:yes gene_type:complete
MSYRFFSISLLLLIVICTGCQTLPLTEPKSDFSDPLIYESLWNSNETAVFVMDKNQYRAVYSVENSSEIELYRIHRINTKKPLSISDVQFKHTNGTIAFESEIHIEQNRSFTLVTLPSKNGKLAFTSPRSGKSFQAPIALSGNYTVILPKDSDISISLLSKVIPSNHTTTLSPNQPKIRWENLSGGAIHVQYYLIRDSQLLAALLLLCSVSLLFYMVHFWWKMKHITKKKIDIEPPV